jgi:hypothetical protein
MRIPANRPFFDERCKTVDGRFSKMKINLLTNNQLKEMIRF